MKGAQAWITSAVEDKIVDKAILLSRSLRRVRTTKKLVVFTTKAVSKHLRENLKEAFDLVVLLDHDFPNGLSLEDYAKVQAFSLMLFNKCVYLSPNALALKNCDEMFEKYSTFATYKNEDDTFDSSVYVFIPSLDKTRAFEKLVHSVDLVCGKGVASMCNPCQVANSTASSGTQAPCKIPFGWGDLRDLLLEPPTK